VSVLTRYIVAQYLRSLLACLAVATSVLFVLEVFEKLGNLEQYAATPATIAAYIGLKVPGFAADAFPATALLATLLSLGLLARSGEMLAMKACGVSRWNLLAPLVASACVVSLVALAWCERVVPLASTRSRLIRDNVIKQRDTHAFRGVSSIWMQSDAGFVTVDYYDDDATTLYGLTVFEATPSMQLERIIEATSARWGGDRWLLDNATAKRIGPGAAVAVTALDDETFVLREPPSSFEKRRPKPKELTHHELGELIATLDSRGLPVDELRVERQLKLAWPACGVVTMLVGFPLAVRGGRRFGIAYNVASGLAVGFVYWAVFAVCVAGGKSGALSPAVAAWLPNLTFATIGLALCARRDV
jgi:lipopolysaccharide export system permease protein